MQIIELHNHSEVVFAIGKMLEYLDIDYEMFANQHVLKDCQTSLKGKKHDLAVMKNQLSNSKKIFTTVLPEDLKILNKLSTSNSIAVIHNFNSFFHRRGNQIPRFSLDGIKSIFTSLKSDKSRPAKVLNKFAFLSAPVDWMIESGKQFKYKWSSRVPFSYCELISSPNPNEFTIGIPGTVNPNNKDYSGLYDAFNELNKHLSKRIQLHFLGSAKSQKAGKVIERFKKIESKWISIKYHRHHVPQTDYLENLSEVQYLIAPLNRRFRLGSIYEYYGKSNISGAHSDMLRYAIPTLWPTYYPLETCLEKITCRYQNLKQLIDGIMNWIEDPPIRLDSRKQVLDTYSISTQSKLLKKALAILNNPD